LTPVLDASMAVAWLFDDERTDGTDEALRRVVAESAIVPSPWRLEVANVLRNAVRRGRCDKEYVDRSIDRLRRLPITVDSETDDAAWEATRALARELGLTLYDAAYLEVARRLGLKLASCDHALLNAAATSGVATLPK
jgi:predicted nucleic acid-binding protein